MAKYYIHNDGKQSDALDKEQLKALKITRDTPIWYEPLKDWTTAGKVEELNDIFENTPPAFNPPKTEEENEDKSFLKLPSLNRNTSIIILVIVSVAIIMLIYKSLVASTIKQNSDSPVIKKEMPTKVYAPKEKKKSASELREELRKNEQNRPLDYLSISASEKQNKIQTRNGTIFRSSEYKIDGYLVEGYISNSATIAVYKNVFYKISYISQTGSIISTENFALYEYIYPSDAVKFERKVYPPSETFSFSYEIVKSSYLNE